MSSNISAPAFLSSPGAALGLHYPGLHGTRLNHKLSLHRSRPPACKRTRAPIRADLFDNPMTRIPHLQDALDDAIAEEQYTTAAAIRDRLHTAVNEDSVQLLAALLKYYDAFNEQSVDRIRKLWRDDIPVICQHPLTACHVGYHPVISSYTSLFQTLPSDLRLEASDVRIATFGCAAIVTCLETPQCESVSTTGRAWNGLLATSIYDKVWHSRRQRFEYLLSHHVSTPMLSTTSML